MSKCEIIHVDFQKGQKTGESYQVLDPVLAQVRDELPPESFAAYKKIVDDWMERNFLYQMENAKE